MSIPSGADHPYVFISYASADRERVLPIVDALQRAGVPVWLDREGIRGGANYGREIATAIQGAAALVLMTSPLSLASRNVKQEIALAWEYERPYVPLLLEPVAIPDDVKYWLTAAQWVEVLDRPAADWLPDVLVALAPLGIAPQERLAGREREQALLRERLTATLAGRGGLVLVGGEAGVGKTTLVEAALAEATAQGALVLVGRCYDLVETPPYGPWVELFGRYRPGLADPPHPPAFATRGTVGAVASQAALVAQVRDWLAALAARQPVAVLLDDLHWADPASLDLLRAVARDLADLSVLVFATYRDDELTRRHPLYTLLPVLEREARAARLDLRRFDAEDMRALVTDRYGLAEEDAPRLVKWLVERAEGNAFFVTQLLRSLEDDGTLRQGDGGWMLGGLAAVGLPAPLRQVLNARLDRLSGEAQRLLALAAAIGQEVPLATWATVAETDEDGLLDTVDAAVEARLVLATPDGTSVRFAHALIREALYEGLVPTRRRRVHRRAGEALVAMSAPDPDAVAYHLQRAGDARAFEWLVRAGLRARRAMAQLTAVERFTAAAALLAQDDTRAAGRGWLLYSSAVGIGFADKRRNFVLLEEAERAAVLADNHVLLALIRSHRGLFLCWAGQIREGLAHLAQGLPGLDALPAEYQLRSQDAIALEAIAALLPGVERVAHGPEANATPTVSPARGTFANWLGHAGRYGEAQATAESLFAAFTAAQGEDFPRTLGLLTGHLALGHAHAALGRPARARDEYTRARAGYRALGLPHLVEYTLWAELLLVALPYYAERVAERAHLAAEATRAWADAVASTGAPFPSLANLLLAIPEGRWAEARALAVAGHSAATANLYHGAIAALGVLAFLQGEADLAWAQVRALHPAGSATEPGDCYFPHGLALQAAAADYALNTGDYKAAHDWIAAHARWLDWSSAVLWQAEQLLLRARLARASDDLAAARAHAEAALARATEPRQPLALLAAHRLLGELDTAEVRHAEATAHLAEALALAEACAAPYERALTLLALTELHLATGDRPHATAMLAEARAILEPLEARPALARAAALAARLAVEHDRA